MKKILGIGLAAVCVLGLATGCGASEEQKTMTCTLERKDVTNGYELASTYKVYYTGKAVDKVETVETVTSDDDEILETFKTTLNTTYDSMNKAYGGYTFNVTKKDKEVKFTVSEKEWLQLLVVTLSREEETKAELDFLHKLKATIALKDERFHHFRLIFQPFLINC